MGIVLLAVLVGCGRQESPAPVVAPQKAQKSPAMPSIANNPAAEVAPTPVSDAATPPGPPGTSAPTAPTMTPAAQKSEFATPEVEVVDVNISRLQEAVGSYERDTKRKPKDLQQLVTERYLPAVPPAPKGKRYVIDQDTLTVKSVPQ